MPKQFNDLFIDVSDDMVDTSIYKQVVYRVHGIPKGGKLSAGIHKGHGTWKLNQNELTDLKLDLENPEQLDDLELSISVHAIDHLGRKQTQNMEIALRDPDAKTIDNAPIEIPDNTVPLSDLIKDEVDSDAIVLIDNIPMQAELVGGELHPEGTWSIETENISNAYIKSDVTLPNQNLSVRIYTQDENGADSLHAYSVGCDIMRSVNDNIDHFAQEVATIDDFIENQPTIIDDIASADLSNAAGQIAEESDLIDA